MLMRKVPLGKGESTRRLTPRPTKYRLKTPRSPKTAIVRNCVGRSFRPGLSGLGQGLLEVVERGTGLEPFELFLGEAVVEPDLILGAVRVPDDGRDRAARRQGREAGEAHPVLLPHLVVVRGIGEGQGQDALFLEVGLVDAGEAF